MKRADGTVAPEPESERALEQAALAGAAAIQRIIAERDSLRRLTQSQAMQLTLLRQAKEESRRRTLVIRRQYLEMATAVLEHFQRFEEALRGAVEGADAEVSRNKHEGMSTVP